jgi:hypothetical protein
MPDASNLPPHAGAGSGAWWWTVIVIVIILIIAAALGLGGANSPRDHNLRQENASPARPR